VLRCFDFGPPQNRRRYFRICKSNKGSRLFKQAMKVLWTPSATES
jgi:site-specific DNA-cytosine methylase